MIRARKAKKKGQKQMKIETHSAATPDMTIDEFAEKHNLTMELRESAMDGWTRKQGLPRYIASFKGAEVKGDSVLSSEFGDGNTPEAAIENYAQQVRGELLVIGAFSESRREIRCPNEWSPRNG
jgi:hypothetical protein